MVIRMDTRRKKKTHAQCAAQSASPPAVSKTKGRTSTNNESVGFLSVEKLLDHNLRTGTSDGTSSVNDIMYIARVGAVVAMPLDHGVATKSMFNSTNEKKKNVASYMEQDKVRLTRSRCVPYRNLRNCG